MKRNFNKSLDPNASKLNHQAYKLGCQYFNQGDFSKAKNSFIESTKYWPEDPQAWFALGDCYDELNKPSKAEECFRESLRYTSADKQSDTLYNLGNSLFDQTKYEEAIECYIRITGQSLTYRQAQKNMDLAKNELQAKNS